MKKSETTAAVKLTVKEETALIALTKNCLNQMGGKVPADLENDPTTWVSVKDLAEGLSITRKSAQGIFSSLEKKGVVAANDGEGWYLTDLALTLAESKWEKAEAEPEALTAEEEAELAEAEPEALTAEEEAELAEELTADERAEAGWVIKNAVETAAEEIVEAIETALKTVKPRRTTSTREKVGIIDTIINVLSLGATKAQILETLENAFPERNPEAMKKTINCQVPFRLARDKGIELVVTVTEKSEKVYKIKSH